MIKVLVAEDNINLNMMYCTFLARDKDIEIVSSTTDGENTIKKYQNLHPDVLLLDLNLPKLNGLDILNNLSLDIEEKHKCNVIVISGSIDMVNNLYNTSKVYRIMPKLANLDDILLTIKEIVPDESVSQREIKSLLLDLKFNPFSIGTKYLIDAINFAHERPELLRNMGLMYKEIAKKYKISPAKVQWSIRSSIDIMNRYISSDLSHTIFHVYAHENITPKFFLTIINDYLNNK